MENDKITSKPEVLAKKTSSSKHNQSSVFDEYYTTLLESYGKDEDQSGASNTLSAEQQKLVETMIDDRKKDFDSEIKKESAGLRKDFIAIFGLFAGFLTFTVLQIQSFIAETKTSTRIGIMAFFLASTLSFVYALHVIAREQSESKKISKSLVAIIIVLLIFSVFCFYYSVMNGQVFSFDYTKF